ETVEYTPEFAEPEEQPEPEEAVAEVAVEEPPPAPVPAPSPAPAQSEERVRGDDWLKTMPEPPALHAAPSAESGAYIAVIRVVGVGGAGLNAVNRMIDAGLSQVEFVAVNTDIQQLQVSDAPTKIHIGRELTEGLGSGADAEVGRLAAEEAYD